MNVLHLTHTDISYDSRILKEMQCIANSNNTYNVSGIGIKKNIGASITSNKNNITIYTIILKTKLLKILPTKIRHIFSYFETALKMIFRAVKLKPKIIHCNDVIVLPIGVIIKIFTGAKLIYDAHELESERNGLTKLQGKIILCTEKLLWRFINALIVVSPSIDEWYKEKIGDKYSEVILNSPVLEKNISITNKQYLRDLFKIPKDSKIFLYIGILGQGRGIDLIIDIFKKFNIKSSVVFLGYGELSEKLKKISREYQNIYVHDAVPHEEVVSIAKSADVGFCLIQKVSLSDYYCLPNKLFEYSFAGIPVLASKFPDISNTVSKYNLGKCSELNLENIYKVIKEFEDTKELPMIDVNDLYDLSWDAQEKKLIKLYDELLN